MPHQFAILHLSDLHERASREQELWRRRRVLGDGFLANLDELLTDGAIDLVCLTGDLADWGLPAEYDAAGSFLAAVMERLKLPRERLFLVPGNHDIARKQSADAWKLLRDNLPGYEHSQISRWFRGRQAPPGLADEHREALLLRQKAFRDFLLSFGLMAQDPAHSPHGRLGYRTSIRLPGRPFDLQVIGLDSAWFSGDNSDAGKLRLTEDQVMQLCSKDGEQLPGFRLALIHHPLTDLADGNHCRRLLAEHADLLLRGHLHDPEPELWADPERRLVQFAAGCLYEGDRADTYPNACQVIRVSVDDAGRPLGYSLRFRAFSPRGGHWHDDNSLYRSARESRLELTADGQVRGPFQVPVPENPYFTGREQILGQVATALSTHQVAAVIQPQALSGLGGIGKTQIAVAFAYRYRARYRTVLWVRGDSEAVLRASFAELSGPLRLPVAADNCSLDDSVAAVRRWLETQPGWLLIVDGADEPDALARWLPRSGRGHVLLTSRAHDFQKLGLVCPLEVDTLSVPDAVEFLLKRTGRAETNAGERAAAEELAKELDGLPLALEQAAAFIVTNAAPIADYLISYRKHRLRLLNRSQPITGDYPHTVATTWHMNFEQIKPSPASVALLKFVAFLAADAIPTELLIKGAEHFDKKLARTLENVVSDPLVLSTLMGPLLRYSLIRRDIDERTVSIHRMVQEVVKDSLDPQVRHEYARRVVGALSAKFPDPARHTDWPGCERFLRHALVAIRHSDEYKLEGEAAARLHNQVALYLDHRMQWQAAEPLYRKAIALRRRIEGTIQANTLNRRNLAAAQSNLSTLLTEIGRSAEALATITQAIDELQNQEGETSSLLAGPLLRRANILRQAGRYLESDHDLQRSLPLVQQDPVASRQSGIHLLALLAANAQALGDYKQAEKRFQQALALCKKLHGKDSPQYVEVQLSFGRLLRDLGRYEDAEAEVRGAMAQIESMVGRQHNQYANAAKVLASILMVRGQHDAAQAILRECLEIWRRLHGPQHSAVAGTLSDLAACLRHQAQYLDAAKLAEQALRMDETLLGIDHPSLQGVLTELGLIYLTLDRFDDADQAFRRSLVLCTKSHGAESPEAATAHNNIALVLVGRGKYPSAIAEYERSIAIQRQCCGDEHPETLLSLHNLAQLFARLGRYQEAKPIYLQVLAGWRKTYGEAHPKVALCLSGLGQVCLALSDGDSAERYFKEAGAISDEIYPPDHPDRAQSLAALGQYYHVRGRYQDARPLLERAFEILHAKEPDSVLTATVMGTLGACLAEQEQYTEAEELLRRAIAQKEARLGPEHPELAPLLTDLGICLFHQDKVSEAEPIVLRALTLTEQTAGTQSVSYATMLSNLGHLRRAQRRLEEATALEKQALMVRQSALGANHAEVAASHAVLGDLASLRGDEQEARELLRKARLGMPSEALPSLRASERMRSGLTQARLGDWQDATTALQEAAATLEAEHGANAPELLDARLSLLAAQLERGELLAAERSLHTIREQMAMLPSVDPDSRLMLHQAEATLLRHLGKLSEARGVLVKALDMEGKHSDEAIAVELRISLLNNLAGVMEAQGERAAAVPQYEQALQLLSRVGEARSRQELELMTLANLASNWFQQGAHDKAAEIYQRVDQRAAAVYSDKHPRYCLILQQRGAQALLLKQWTLARQLLERAYSIADGSWSSEHPKWGMLYRQLGMAAEGEDAVEQAAAYYAKAIHHDELSYGKDAPELRAALEALSHLTARRGEQSLAIEYAKRRAHISRVQQPPDPENLVRDEASLGFRLRDANKFEEAGHAFERALAVLEKYPAAVDAAHRPALHIDTAKLHLQRGDASGARQHLEQAIKFYAEYPPKRDLDLHQLAAARDLLAGCWVQVGQLEDAGTEYRESLRLRRLAVKRMLGAEAATLTNLSQLYWITGQPEQAVPLLQEALDLARQAKDWWAYVHAGGIYARILNALKRNEEEQPFLEELLPIARETLGDESELTRELSSRLSTLRGSPQPSTERAPS